MTWFFRGNMGVFKIFHVYCIHDLSILFFYNTLFYFTLKISNLVKSLDLTLMELLNF